MICITVYLAVPPLRGRPASPPPKPAVMGGVLRDILIVEPYRDGWDFGFFGFHEKAPIGSNNEIIMIMDDLMRFRYLQMIDSQWGPVRRGPGPARTRSAASKGHEASPELAPWRKASAPVCSVSGHVLEASGMFPLSSVSGARFHTGVMDRGSTRFFGSGAKHQTGHKKTRRLAWSFVVFHVVLASFLAREARFCQQLYHGQSRF